MLYVVKIMKYNEDGVKCTAGVHTSSIYLFSSRQYAGK